MPGSHKGFDNDCADWENIELNIPDPCDFTVWVNKDDSGGTTETDTTKMLQKGTLGKGFVLRPANQDVSIVTIHTKTFRNPISVAAQTVFTARQIRDFKKIVIRTTASNSFIQLLVL